MAHLLQLIKVLFLVAGVSMLRAVASPCRPETSVSCRDGSTPEGETCRVCERTVGGNSGDGQSFDTGCILTEGDSVYDGPCSATVDIHEGIRGMDDPLQFLRSGNVTLHSLVAFACENIVDASLSWIITENGSTIYVNVIKFWSNGEAVPVDGLDLYLPEKTMPVGLFLLQLSVNMTTTTVPHAVTGVLQTWLQFRPLPIVALIGLGAPSRPLHSITAIRYFYFVYAWGSWDREGLVPSSDFSYSWTCEPVRLPDPALFSTTSACASLFGRISELAPGHIRLRSTNGRILNATFVVTFEVTAIGREPAYASMYIHTPEVLWTRWSFTIKCYQNCIPEMFNVQEMLHLEARYSTRRRQEWSIVEAPIEFPGLDWTNNVTELSERVLKVRGGVFQVRGYYTVRATSFENPTDPVVTEYRFRVPSPPTLKSGRYTIYELPPHVCYISPTDGRSLASKFCIICEEFLDENRPVYYEMKYRFVPNGVDIASSYPPSKSGIEMEVFRGLVAQSPMIDLPNGNITIEIRVFTFDGLQTDWASPPLQVQGASSLKVAFETTRKLSGNWQGNSSVLSVDDVDNAVVLMFTGSAKLLEASETMARSEFSDGNSYSSNLEANKRSTSILFEALDVLDDIYLNPAKTDVMGNKTFTHLTMPKVHLTVQPEIADDSSEKLYIAPGGSDSLIRVPSFSSLMEAGCPEGQNVGIQFLESDFNPFEYSNNSRNIQADVMGLAVKCGNTTLPVSGLTDPIDILSRREDHSLNGSMYTFAGSAALVKAQVFAFHVKKTTSSLSFVVDVNTTAFPHPVTLLLRKGAPPTTAAYNWTTTLPLSEDQLFSIPWRDNTSLNSDPYQWMLPTEDINFSPFDVGNMTDYYIGIEFASTANGYSNDNITFTLHVFETSCVYFAEGDAHLWHSEGCKVGLLSNLTHIHCQCDHLTKFSGFVAPNPLNIQEALSANVLENPAGLILVLVVFSSYLLGVLWARKADRKDLTKAGVGLLPGHKLNPCRDCQYLITINTGFRGNAGTTAEVSLILHGFHGESLPITLRDPGRFLFEKGSVDSFMVSTDQPLGGLTHLQVWHNNAGYSPSWFLSQVVVVNKATNVTTYFLCNRWLAIDKEDGKIERAVPSAGPDEMTKFRNIFLAKSARDMNDGHLWFSVAGRPARSPFTRVQRLSCCLTLLYSTMLTNIMFFGRGDDFDPPEPLRIAGLEIKPPISFPQLMIGIQSAAIIMPVNLLIVFLFRQSDKKGWCLVCSGSFVAAFFTVLYTLSFGRQKAEAWVFTFVTSFFTDLFLVQPIKLIMVAILFALLAKKPVEDEDPPPSSPADDEEYIHSGVKEDERTSQKSLGTATGWLRYVGGGGTSHRRYSVDTQTSSAPPDPSMLAEQRAKSEEKRKRRNAVMEVFGIALFVAVIMLTAYGERSPIAFYMTQNVQGLTQGATGVNDISSFWTWIRDGLVPATHTAVQYNGRASSAELVLDDMLTHPVGAVRLRQVRLKPGERCEVPEKMRPFTSRCLADFTFLLADSENYTKAWVPINDTMQDMNVFINTSTPSSYPVTSDIVTSGMGHPWNYTFASLSNDFPYFGEHGTYFSGGYQTTLGTNSEASLTTATYLQDHQWLDQQTRAVFVELILYNPHANLFSVVTVVVEFTTSGAADTSSEVVTLRLVQHEAILLLTLRVTLALFLLFFLLREGKSLLSRPVEYLSEFWSWVEVLIITIGFSTLAVYFKAQGIIDEVTEIRQSGSTPFEEYKSAAGWFQVYTYLLGILICCSTLKFIHLLRFNSHVQALSVTMKKSAEPVLQFLFVASIFMMAYTQAGNLVFGVKLQGYKNIQTSLQSLCMMMLGSFDFDELSGAKSVLGPLMFFSYQAMMQFILLSMFMTIIMDVYAEEQQPSTEEGLQLSKFVKETSIEIVDILKVASKTKRRDAKQNEDNVIEPDNASRFYGLIDEFGKMW
ncbi:PKD1L3 [Branchiostoma lanceolatum]|uniref:PKD1L3 protein n=1 Tax=Branchiostoma lanceolatum TaxID=7740 RepID=A0A8K0EW84_BRALA|nr:PKD1L3 [Branchiostoma lanceolatum]